MKIKTKLISIFFLLFALSFILILKTFFYENEPIQKTQLIRPLSTEKESPPPEVLYNQNPTPKRDTTQNQDITQEKDLNQNEEITQKTHTNQNQNEEITQKTYTNQIIDSDFPLFSPQTYSIYDKPSPLCATFQPLFKQKENIIFNHCLPSWIILYPQPETYIPTIHKKSRILLVLDDMGASDQQLDDVLLLPTQNAILSFIPYGKKITPMIKRAVQKNRVVFLHMPMEPLHNLRPNEALQLKIAMNKKEIEKNLNAAFQLSPYFVGLNNHTGSLFTSSMKPMLIVMHVLKSKKIFFLDSKTYKQSVGIAVAKEFNVPHIARDIFLDNKVTTQEVKIQLQNAMILANQHPNRIIVMIGHPHHSTLSVLNQWLKIHKLMDPNELMPSRQLLEWIKESQAQGHRHPIQENTIQWIDDDDLGMPSSSNDIDFFASYPTKFYEQQAFTSRTHK